MKTKSLILVAAILFVTATLAPAATNDLSSALQRGLFEEEANHNLDAAITAYQSVATQFDKDRKLAATAIFRLGEVYRKQGKTNEANAQYERILREFSDQPELVKLSRSFVAATPSTNAEANYIRQLEGLRDEARADHIERVTKLSALKKLPRNELKNSLATIRPQFNEMLKQQKNTEKELADRLIKYTADHPEVRDAQTVVGVLNKQIEEKMDDILSGLDAQAALSQIKAEELQNQINKARADQPKQTLLTQRDEKTKPTVAPEDQEIARIKAMIKDSPDLINAWGVGGIPLHQAAENNWTRVAEFLLDNGADVNRRDNEGTAIHLSASAGHKAMVELLIAHGADLESKNLSAGSTALHIASQKGFKAIAEILLTKRADANAKNNNGATSLHLAGAAGHKAVAELLLANGVNIDAKNSSGQTPMFSAISSKNLEMAKFLIANKADVNAKSIESETPLHAAVSSKDLEMARLLIASKANINAIGKEGVTPLHAAVFGNQLKFVELLLQNGAKTEAKYDGNNYKGWTPLLFATQSSYAEIVETLLKSGANPNSTNDSGETPLYFAIGRGSQKIAELLLANKADPNIQTKNGVTPLGMAKKLSSPAREELIAVLLKYGANENTERLSRISVSREPNKSGAAIFSKGNNPYNRYNLFELMARMNLSFPDLTKVKIHRLDERTQKTRDIDLNVEEILKAGDCSKNIWLEWGDIVEIPELDHPINQRWSGYPKEYAGMMQKCLERKVSITVKGETTNMTLHADLGQNQNGYIVLMGNGSFGQVINPFLRASSDKTRIKVKRADPVTKQKLEIIMNLEKPQNPDLWLRDGDAIEIPERDPNAPPAASDNSQGGRVILSYPNAQPVPLFQDQP